MVGHKRAQCWLNGAVYEWCRANDKISVNYSYRAFIKLKKKLDSLRTQRDMEEKFLRNAASAEVELKNTLALKRAKK